MVLRLSFITACALYFSLVKNVDGNNPFQSFLAAQNTCSALYKKNFNPYGSACTGSSCGSCFNAGARPGLVCKGKDNTTGYFCPPDSPGPDDDMAFACMDWTFGSSAMKKAETNFEQRTGESVFFGVGTFGTSDDPQRGLGACYRLKIKGVEKELLLQSVNTGSDVSGFQFDLQMGDGGAGAYNACAGGERPGHDSMFPGSYDESTWGKQFGGADSIEQCDNLPPYPAKDEAAKMQGDNLQELCKYSFAKKVRGATGGNNSIQQIGRVECPQELVHFTQFKRKDDPIGFQCGVDTKKGCVQAPHDCPGGSDPWCLTRMMDCRKPSGAVKDNVKEELMVAGHKVVQTCTSDGYTRFDVQCGCFDCYC